MHASPSIIANPFMISLSVGYVIRIQENQGFLLFFWQFRAALSNCYLGFEL
jgi:hypothetical protein